MLDTNHYLTITARMPRYLVELLQAQLNGQPAGCYQLIIGDTTMWHEPVSIIVDKLEEEYDSGLELYQLIRYSNFRFDGDDKVQETLAFDTYKMEEHNLDQGILSFDEFSESFEKLQLELQSSVSAISNEILDVISIRKLKNEERVNSQIPGNTYLLDSIVIGNDQNIKWNRKY
ncbi:hypothetical protein OH460_07655 [Vibrio sp. Makdt]|uniref:hypothetical protein n=1 Tax=Vibrio sp. Makdt TaxID=2998828 RepID=UPI0022CD30A2|nr:hypothetical protein [Vibrio sp. Makdt]MDA0152171.1 hypothetical protein [Vibrio sp. Makdt]